MSAYRQPTPPTEPPIATEAELATFRKELASADGARFTELYAALGALAFVAELIVLGSAAGGSIPLPARLVLAVCALAAVFVAVKAVRHEVWLHRLGRAGIAPDRWNTSLARIRRLHAEWSANVPRSRIGDLEIDVDTSDFEHGPSSTETETETTREPIGEVFVAESERAPRISA